MKFMISGFKIMVFFTIIFSITMTLYAEDRVYNWVLKENDFMGGGGLDSTWTITDEKIYVSGTVTGDEFYFCASKNHSNKTNIFKLENWYMTWSLNDVI